MSRSLLVGIAVALLLIGGVLFGLSRIDPTKDMTRVEKMVPENALAQ